MNRIAAIKRPFVMHGMHFLGQRMDATLLVGNQRAIFPAAFPQLVGQLQKVLGPVIAAVVRIQTILPQTPRPAIHIAGHDVPAYAAIA